jgi:cytochrome c2
MRRFLTIAAVAVFPLAAHAAGDPAAGKVVFQQCAICHSNEKGVNRVGPSLFGVVGRHSHTEPGYDYSPAMMKHDVTWNADTLNVYLTDPMKVVPGTKMIFPGIKDDAKRADVIAYLETLK